jgi:hypothetical protein
MSPAISDTRKGKNRQYGLTKITEPDRKATNSYPLWFITLIGGKEQNKKNRWIALKGYGRH